MLAKPSAFLIAGEQIVPNGLASQFHYPACCQHQDGAGALLTHATAGSFDGVINLGH